MTERDFKVVDTVIADIVKRFENGFPIKTELRACIVGREVLVGIAVIVIEVQKLDIAAKIANGVHRVEHRRLDAVRFMGVTCVHTEHFIFGIQHVVLLFQLVNVAEKVDDTFAVCLAVPEGFKRDGDTVFFGIGNEIVEKLLVFLVHEVCIGILPTACGDAVNDAGGRTDGGGCKQVATADLANLLVLFFIGGIGSA